MDVNFRAFDENDVVDLTNIINAVNEADAVDDRMTEEGLRKRLSIPNAIDNLTIAENEAGMVIAGILGMLDPNEGRVYGNIMLHPDYRNNEIYAILHDELEAHIMRQAHCVKAGRPIYIQQGVLDSRQKSMEMVESVGYVAIRRYYTMQIMLGNGGEVEKPSLPSGIVLKPFDRELHARRVHAAQNDAFRDHWGYGDGRPFEEWVSRIDDPNVDTGLWQIAWDDGEVVGMSLCSFDASNKQIGLVRTVGVRPQWRRQGLGMALLKRSFVTLSEHGCSQVRLMVDTGNESSALGLYERAGMSVLNCIINYRKVLRGVLEDTFD